MLLLSVVILLPQSFRCDYSDRIITWFSRMSFLRHQYGPILSLDTARAVRSYPDRLCICLDTRFNQCHSKGGRRGTRRRPDYVYMDRAQPSLYPPSPHKITGAIRSFDPIGAADCIE